MKILLADKFQQSGIDALTAANHNLIDRPDLNQDNLNDAVTQHDPDILVVRSTKVLAPVFDNARKLSLVVRAGAGYDNIDLPAASRNAISVANCPGKNAVAVAELTIGLLIAADRSIPAQTADLKAGTWAKKTYAKSAAGLKDRTLAVIGLGHIGTAVVQRAHALELNINAWSRSLDDRTAKALGVTRAATPLEAARHADALTIHTARTPETTGLINAEILNALKTNAILVNTARGGIADETAILDAMNNRGLKYAADVYDKQPAPTDTSIADTTKELAKHPNFIGTHHCGASTEQAQEATAAEAVRIIQTYADTGTIPNTVNRETKSPATQLLRVRHLNKAGVLAHIVSAISDANINIEEMENVIYAQGEGACAKIQLDTEPSAEAIEAIRKGKHVLSADLTTIP